MSPAPIVGTEGAGAIPAASPARRAGRPGLREASRRLRHILWARIALRSCSSVGARVGVRGRVWVENAGTIRIGDRVQLRGTPMPIEFVVLPGAVLEIGARTLINVGTSISAQTSVTIGEDCMIGHYVLIMDTDFHDIDDRSRGGRSAPVRIQDGVWLGARATVLKGVTIGTGSVVSAGSVVALDVPPYTVVGGVPARVIGKIDPPTSVR